MYFSLYQGPDCSSLVFENKSHFSLRCCHDDISLGWELSSFEWVRYPPTSLRLTYQNNCPQQSLCCCSFRLHFSSEVIRRHLNWFNLSAKRITGAFRLNWTKLTISAMKTHHKRMKNLWLVWILHPTSLYMWNWLNQLLFYMIMTRNGGLSQDRD